MKVGVLFVSHRLDEVRAITDRVSILRDGRLVQTSATNEISERELISAMLGRSLDDLYPDADSDVGDVVLRVRGLSSPSIRPIDLELRRGEVLGLTGLLGMGQEKLPYLLFGAEPATGGSLQIKERTIDVRELSPSVAIAQGFSLLPADRNRESSVGVASVAENVSLPRIRDFFRGWRLDRRAERRRVAALLRDFEVRPADPGRLFRTLSGGNQQKALLAKWFQTQPRVLLLHEPTQGVDVGARSQIFSQIREASRLGCSVVIASTEYEDLAHVCDRVLVFRDGAVRATLSGDSLSSARIVSACYVTA
jgi:ribose transport system ATP-binding protein